MRPEKDTESSKNNTDQKLRSPMSQNENELTFANHNSAPTQKITMAEMRGMNPRVRGKYNTNIQFSKVTTLNNLL